MGFSASLKEQELSLTSTQGEKSDGTVLAKPDQSSILFSFIPSLWSSGLLKLLIRNNRKEYYYIVVVYYY